MKETLIVTFASFIAGLAVLEAMGAFLDLPTVEKHWPSEKCIRVLTPAPSEWSCDNLPKKYTTVWVSPAYLKY